MKRYLLCASVLAGLGFCGAAQAQTTRLDEIVITAQRREETLQKAGISAAAVTGESVQNAGVTNPVDLTRLIPAIQIATSSGPSPQFYMRGVGNFAANPFTDSAVAFNYDGVFIARPGATNGFFYDLQRIEVLKGPQGTLYGRNATGGVMNVLPNTPTLGEFGGDATVGVGNYDMLQAAGAVNLPITDTLAARVAFNSNRHDGYLSDGTEDEDSQGARVQLYWEPTDTFNLRLSGDYFHTGGRGGGSIALTAAGVPLMGDPRIGVTDPRTCPVFDATWFAAAPGVQCPPNDSFANNRYWGVHAVANWDLGFGTLTVLPAHRDTKLDFKNNGGPIITQRDHNQQDTLEVRFASDAEQRFNWVLGAYYLKEKGRTPLFQPNLLTLGSTQRMDLDTESWAVFGQARYSVTDRLRVVGGVRYTRDDKSFFGTITTLALPNNTSDSWNATTGKVAVEFDLAEDSLFYASYEKGFKAGGFFFFPVGLGRNAFDPEHIDAYSVGVKNRLLDNRLQLNLDIFQYNYTDQQVSHPKLIVGFGNFFPTENVGESRIRGFELESQFLVTDNTRVSANVQYVDGEYTSFSYVVPITRPVSGCSVTSVAGAVPPSFKVDCSGKRPVNAPEWTVNLGLNQTFPLPNGGSLVGAISTHYQTDMVGFSDYTPGEMVDAYWWTDLSLTYNAPDDRWSLTAWVNNLNDEVVVATPFGTGLVAAPPLFAAQPVYARLRPPRTYGLRLTAHFGGPAEPSSP